MNRLCCYLLLVFVVISYSVKSQSLKNSIDGNDIWGAWIVKGTSTAWIVDGIPERARLWNYQTGKVITSFDLEQNVREINLLDDGSLAYVKHGNNYAYIVLREDGSQNKVKFGYNATSYCIHPGGKYFLGSINNGFVTYTIKGKKTSKSKLNKDIKGRSNGFLETAFDSAVLRLKGDSIQKIDIAPNGSLSSSAHLSGGRPYLSFEKNELLLLSSKEAKVYSLPDLQLKRTLPGQDPKGFLSGIYDRDRMKLICSMDNTIATLNLETGKWDDNVDLGVGDVYFADRDESDAICFSDTNGKFYIIDLQSSRL